MCSICGNRIFLETRTFYTVQTTKATTGGVYKKDIPKYFAKLNGQKHVHQSLFLNKVWAQTSNFTKKETPTQLFPCEFRAIFTGTFLLNSQDEWTCRRIKKIILNKKLMIARSSHQRCSIWKGVLRNLTKSTGNTCAKNTFFTEHLWTSFQLGNLVTSLRRSHYVITHLDLFHSSMPR